MLFQENDRLGFRINIVALRPDNVASTLPAISELCFNIDQPFDLTVCVLTPGDFRNVHMLTVERFPQNRFRVFRAEAIQTNIPLATGRLNAHMSTSLDPASRFFSCTLRIGELLALTCDCVNISDESIQAGKASISITKELQRVSKKAMKALDSKDIITVFPDQGLHNRTALVLKAPKTPTSIRKVFLPKTVAEMLVAWKMEQDAAIEAIGNEYADFNLVIATPVGLPCESAQIRKALKNLIEENNLPPVVFHSLRHSSITYKLKLNQGDIKSVQGDSGHAQASMVTDQYSHILDENRQENAKLLEKAFYNGHGAEPEAEVKRKQIAVVDQMNAMGFDPLQLAKVLSNPDIVKMLQMLSKSATTE